jgi:hypothetical protein
MDVSRSHVSGSPTKLQLLISDFVGSHRLSEMEVARLGHWVFAHMILSYLTNIPAGALLVMGGFPAIKKAYHVPRFHVAVPSGLPTIFAKAHSQLEELNGVSTEVVDKQPRMPSSARFFKCSQRALLLVRRLLGCLRA